MAVHQEIGKLAPKEGGLSAKCVGGVVEGRGTSRTGRLATLLSAAAWAPSGDNTQPWHFQVDAGRIAIRVDESRDPSPMNTGQRMARIAVGAALENLLRTAAHNGWEATLRPASAPDLAVIEAADLSGEAGSVEEVILARVTNRRLYDGRPLPSAVLARLREVMPMRDEVQACWLADHTSLASWAQLVSRADAVMFGEPLMRRAFLANVRLNATGSVAEGLSPASLELGPSQRLALRLVRRLPDWVVAWSSFVRQVAAHSHRLVESASGLCLLVAPNSQEATDVAVGRAVQRAWLALTAEGLAVQPMMSLLVLENIQERGSDPLRAALGGKRLQALGEEFRRLAPVIGDGRPAFLMRFGYAPPPQGRTGRLPI